MTTHHPRSITGPVMIGARFVLPEPGTARSHQREHHHTRPHQPR